MTRVIVIALLLAGAAASAYLTYLDMTRAIETPFLMKGVF